MHVPGVHICVVTQVNVKARGLGDWFSGAITLFGGFLSLLLFRFTCIWHERMSAYVHVGGNVCICVRMHVEVQD